MIETHTDRKITLQISKDTLKNSAIYGTIILHKQNIKKQRAEGMGKVVVLMEHLEQYLQHTLSICWISRFRINDNYDYAKMTVMFYMPNCPWIECTSVTYKTLSALGFVSVRVVVYVVGFLCFSPHLCSLSFGKEMV